MLIHPDSKFIEIHLFNTFPAFQGMGSLCLG